LTEPCAPPNHIGLADLGSDELSVVLKDRMREFKNIKWKAFLKANSEKNETTLITRICNKIACSPDVKSIEKYWKDESLYVASFDTTLNVDNIKDAVF